jgi:tetratricopeptide (TPR) repeat protein
VKPANIMIDENGWAVMTDFGIAKVEDGHDLTATGTAVGSPHYMAPEQFQNQPLTAAADQYALGIVAYEMLTGGKPFDGNSLAEIITQHLFNKPPDIKKDRPDLPVTVSNAVARMLAKEPGARFPDLESAVAALGAPDPTRLDEVRARLMSFSRSAPARAPRLSAPLSPVPTPRPPAPTTRVPTGRPAGKRTSAGQAPREAPNAFVKALLLAAAIVVLLAVPGYFAGRQWMANRASPESNAALRRGVQLWQEQKGDIAEAEFTAAARQLPASALPRIFLSRLARERGDLNTALAEAGHAVRLEPASALALREMGSVLLARGDHDGARRFFVRAVRANPRDQVAMGWLACALHRLGESDQAARWSARAGVGGWSSCLR